MFHDFEIVNRKTGRALQLTGIGPTAEYAAATIKRYNFAGIDFENDYELRNCTHPNIDEAETESGDCACGCRDYRFCPDCEESVEVDG